MKLGTLVNNIRHGKSYVKKRADLEGIGFDFNRQEIGIGYEAIKVALQTYKDLNGDMLVSQKFIVPVNDITWPKETWGMKLGIIVKNIRAGKSCAENRLDLESIGFNYSSQSLSHGYKLGEVVLQTNEDLNGDMSVPQNLVVTEDDISSPKETWGLNLGTLESSINQGSLHVDNQEDLGSIECNHDSQSRNHGYELGNVALQTYEDSNGDMLVPATFVEPVNDITWPEVSKSMTTSHDGIISRQAADYEPSEPAAMVAKSSFDTFPTPGIYTYMIMQRVCMQTLSCHTLM
jgi:hypothetical protein